MNLLSDTDLYCQYSHFIGQKSTVFIFHRKKVNYNYVSCYSSSIFLNVPIYMGCFQFCSSGFMYLLLLTLAFVVQ